MSEWISVKVRGQQIKNPVERLKSLMVINPKSQCWEWIGTFKGKTKLKQYGSLVVVYKNKPIPEWSK